MNIEKIKKQTKKNRKKQIKSEYKNFMWRAKQAIKFSTENYCEVECKNYPFVIWLVVKKLERQGFKCEVRRSYRFILDRILLIEW